jgi:hypothetical protein
MANIIEVIIKANDQLSTGLDKAQQSVNKFNASSILAFAGVTLSIGAMVGALKKVSDAGAVAEQADVKLATAMRRVGQYSEENFRALSQQATALARVSWADDEEIKRSQSLLLSFGVQRMALDGLLRATMDFAAFTGTDLNAATLLVGRAFMGTSESVGRYNLGLTAAAGTVERATQMQAGFNAICGGEAQAAIGTYTGKIHELHEAMSELSEGPGQELNIRLGIMATLMTRVLYRTKDLSDANAPLITKITDWAARLDPLMAAFKIWDELLLKLGFDTESLTQKQAKWQALYARVPGMTSEGGGTAAGATGSAGALGYMPQTWVVKSRTGARSQMQDLSKDLIDAGNAARTMGAALEAAFNENMARAQQFASVISSGITNSLISAATAGGNFVNNLMRGFGRVALQIAEMILQMVIMKALMGSTTFMGFFGFAQGGKIPGAYNGLLVGGTPGRDSIPIMAAPKERILSVEGNNNLEKLLARLASGSGGITQNNYINALDTSSMDYELRYGKLGRAMIRAGGF